MRKIDVLIAVFSALASASSLFAQFGPPAAAPAAAAAAPAAAGAAGAPGTIWQFLGLTYENCERHRKHLCSKPIGQLLNAMTSPLGMATGGLIPPLCPPIPSEEELKKLLDPNNANVSPAEAVAAKIKAMEAQAAARRAAVRFLGTVDCHWFPEAEGALIAALRQDTNECVRWEAALALGKGCCCTKKTVAALMISASSKDTDGNPSENSHRVKSEALYALNLCTTKLAMIPEEPPVPPELPPESNQPPTRPESPVGVYLRRAFGSGIQLTAYYTQRVPRTPRISMMREAAAVLAQAAGNRAPARTAPHSGRGLLQLWTDAAYTGPAREEISFEVAALSAPGRSNAKRQKNSGVRASISFQSENVIQQANMRDPFALLDSEQPRAELRKSYSSPVAWPGTGPEKENQTAPPIQSQRKSSKSPAPVPWPTPQPVSAKNQASKKIRKQTPSPVPWPDPIVSSRSEKAQSTARSETSPKKFTSAGGKLTPEQMESRLPRSRTTVTPMRDFATPAPQAAFSASQATFRPQGK